LPAIIVSASGVAPDFQGTVFRVLLPDGTTAIRQTGFQANQPLLNTSTWSAKSDATPDRMGDVLEPGGCQLDDFRRNPIMLAQHDANQPIGSWPSIQTSGGRLVLLRQ
jgi:hypothetical protein